MDSRAHKLETLELKNERRDIRLERREDMEEGGILTYPGVLSGHFSLHKPLSPQLPSSPAHISPSYN